MVYGNTQYEESIDLRVLLAWVLRKWIWLLIAAVAGALLLGTYKGVLRPEKVGSAAEIEALQETIDNNTEKISQNEAGIAANRNGIAERQEKIAANEELLATQQEMQETLEETLSLLRTSLQQAQTVLTEPNALSNQTTNVITHVIMLSDDVRDTETQLNSVINCVSNMKKEMEAWQMEIDKMTADNKTLEETNMKLRREIEAQEAEMVTLTRDAGSVKTISYAATGAMLGTFVSCGIIFLCFVLNDKLRTASELKERYGFPILGEFWSAKAKNHNKFNRMLDRLAGDVQTLPEEKQVYELIAAGVQTPDFPLPVQLAVTGTARREALQEVGFRLNSLLPESYKLTVVANPMYNPEPLANLKKYTILLVEEKGISDKREIGKLAEVLNRNDVKVIGAVVL